MTNKCKCGHEEENHYLGTEGCAICYKVDKYLCTKYEPMKEKLLWDACGGIPGCNHPQGEQCDCPCHIPDIKGDWEGRWTKFCETEGDKFDRFSKLQRSGIAGVFEIEGKFFIRTEIEKAKNDLISEVLEKLPKKKECPNHEEPGVECYGYDEYYNQCLDQVEATLEGLRK